MVLVGNICSSCVSVSVVLIFGIMVRNVVVGVGVFLVMLGS